MHEADAGMDDMFTWLQQWYEQQCDGEWEHHSGITITTLDNPGWLIRIQLRGTALEYLPFEPVMRGTSVDGWVQDSGDRDWLYCRVFMRTPEEGRIFEGASGPERLREIVQVFHHWCQQSGVEHIM